MRNRFVSSLTLLFSIFCALTISVLAQDISLPASFIGTFPCADCPGIRYHVDLLPDHTFSSRMEYEERNHSFDDHGTWRLDGKTLTLRSAGGSNEKFTLHDENTLRKLDGEGHEIQSRFNYDLKRTSEFQPIGVKASAGSNPPLENTYWKLTDVGGAPATSASQRQEAHIILNSEDHHVSGSSGCNGLSGGYEFSGNHLTFTQMASTRMACAEGMDTEAAFLKALDQVRMWKIDGQQLELLDADGKALATLSAVAKK